MKRFAFLLWLFTLAAGCIVEDKPITPPGDAGVDAGDLCGTVSCPADRPLCSDALECVQCTADELGYCTDQGLICNTESMTCIECSGDADCTAINAAKCDVESNACVPCDSRNQCDDVEGLPGVDNACDDEGMCVDCTPETEAETCPGNKSCEPRTRTCTTTEVGSVNVCEPCVADSECSDNGDPTATYRCVPMFYPNPQTRFPDDQTGFCMKTTEGDCERPYSIPLPNRPSLSAPSVGVDYCGIDEQVVTCPALRALELAVGCANGTSCPPSGICTKVGDVSDQCTYSCSQALQCPAGAPADTCGSCGSGGGDCCGG